ncbi:RNA polymerase II elongation factor Ell [Neocloeon triangulifer]|uniref:RNA polymerase II elongation factor Ell n=1 Tax=Neocloeon triangulifer TaxID=2078957 RepID=UPI00286EC0BF|nr:RNA polymerase II elongation factor Ell [Neocloeon triangulifer]
MATLLAGEQYGLKSSENSRQNKSFVFVKLTDSAYRAIEEYIRNSNKISQHPTIKFLESEGLLSFPSPQPNNGHTFKFSISSVADIEGSQGSFMCVRQNGPRSLDALGTLQSKMQIQAKEDVYEAARKNWVAAEQKQKKNCTQVIKANGPDIGRKVKRVQKAGGNNLSGLVPRREPSPPIYRHKMTPSLPHLVSSSNNTNLPSRHSKPSAKLDILKSPLRERLIHLLALRPFKKIEIINRISNDGIRMKEKNSLSMVLKQVAHLRDNTYHLNHSLWNDVQEDWPFYSEQDKQVLKRRKPQNLTPPGSDGGSSSGSGQSPTSTHPGSPPSIISSSDLSAKRPGYYDGADGLITKKPRISHYRRPEPISMPVSSSQQHRAPSPLLSLAPRGMDIIEPRRSMTSLEPTREPVVKESSREPKVANQTSRSSCPRVTSTSCSPDSQLEGLDKSAVVIHKPDTPPADDYLLKYTTIRTPEQRNQYKAEFNAKYGEYRKLHSIVEQVAQRFNALQEQLKREENGSEGWKTLKNRIMKEYEENKSNSKYQNAKQRLNHLHEMLSHVKHLVQAYDVSNARQQQPSSYY